MKLLNLCFCLLVVLTFAACGGGNTANTSGTGNTGDHGHDHDHDDHSGEKHAMGQIDLGSGYRLEVAHIGKIESGKEVIFEIVVKKDGKETKDADVTCQMKGADDADLTTAEPAEWNGDENLYDGHLQMPKSLPEGAQLIVRVRHGDGFDKSHKFAIEGHDHE